VDEPGAGAISTLDLSKHSTLSVAQMALRQAAGLTRALASRPSPASTLSWRAGTPGIAGPVHRFSSQSASSQDHAVRPRASRSGTSRPVIFLGRRCAVLCSCRACVSEMGTIVLTVVILVRLQPLAPGEKRVKEDWENIFYYGFFGSMALFAVVYAFKPDTRCVRKLPSGNWDPRPPWDQSNASDTFVGLPLDSLESWALAEARRRMAERGETPSYTPSQPSATPPRD
jgi:hypothetical protein